MNTRTIFRRQAATALAAALFFVHHATQACPGCKQAVGMGDGAGGSRAVNSVGVAYALSIGLLLFMIAAVISSLGYMMYRNCRIIAARQSAMLAAEDAAGEFSGGMISA